MNNIPRPPGKEKDKASNVARSSGVLNSMTSSHRNDASNFTGQRSQVNAHSISQMNRIPKKPSSISSNTLSLSNISSSRNHSMRSPEMNSAYFSREKARNESNTDQKDTINLLLSRINTLERNANLASTRHAHVPVNVDSISNNYIEKPSSMSRPSDLAHANMNRNISYNHDKFNKRKNYSHAHVHRRSFKNNHHGVRSKRFTPYSYQKGGLPRPGKLMNDYHNQMNDYGTRLSLHAQSIHHQFVPKPKFGFGQHGMKPKKFTPNTRGVMTNFHMTNHALFSMNNYAINIFVIMLLTLIIHIILNPMIVLF